MTLTFGSLFAGIGGFDLGFERAGLTCSWQVELDPFCRKVLAKHWSAVRRWDDIRTFPPTPNDDWSVDVICGGFPCQDISNAGKRAGIDGERSGIWVEFARCVRILRPRFVVVENTGSIAVRGLGRVLGDLSSLGFDAEWSIVSACSLGAPHTRERLFVVAHAHSQKRGQLWGQQFAKSCRQEGNVCKWSSEPEPLRVADGIPNRLDRNHCLGNAVMPQITELVAQALLASVAHELPALPA